MTSACPPTLELFAARRVRSRCRAPFSSRGVGAEAFRATPMKPSITRQAVLSALKEVQKRHSLPARSFQSLRHYFLPALACGGQTSKRRKTACVRASSHQPTKSENPASGAGFSVCLWSLIVGAGRFELPTFRTRTERATKLRYAPKGGGGQWSEGFDLSRMRSRWNAIFVQQTDRGHAGARAPI
jgi:hypothetical protein